MIKKIIVMLLMLALSSTLLFSDGFEKEKTETADGQKFTFPDDALRKGTAIFALTMGKDRDNGEVQQKQAIGWQVYFDKNPSVVGTMPVYHFPVLAGIPGIVKGTIKKALYKFYADKADPSRVGVLFISNADTFARKAGFPSDDNATLVVVASDGTVKGYVKGELTLSKVEDLKKLLVSP